MTTLRLQSRAADARERYQFRTRDGIHSDDAFREGELLALDYCWDVDLGDLLVAQANYGVVGVVLAEQADSVTMTESSARASECCRTNARENDADLAVRTVDTPARLDQRFDTAVYVPRPYTPQTVGKQRVVDTLERLRPGGTLYVAGSDVAGLSRYEECLAALGCTPETVTSSTETDLVRVTRPSDVSAPRYVETRKHETSVVSTDLTLVSAPGLFASGGLDHGTRLLLESIDLVDGERVLDLCCGYGPVGTYAGLVADCSVVLTDDDARATRCAERTLTENDVDGTVVTADCLSGVSDRSFDVILSNPPTHAGSGVLSDLFDGASDSLASGGRFRFVHHRSLDLSRYLTEFESVRRIAEGEEHVVYEARK